MNLMTAEIRRAFEEYPLYSQDGKGYDARVVVKYFDPISSGTWIITEGQPSGNDYEMFGLCYIDYPEWGYVSLNELQSIGLSRIIGIERDLDVYPGESTVREVAKWSGIPIPGGSRSNNLKSNRGRF